ncbi:hypothetical protein THSYN_17560 [Candidatus Thiodictyon syntrophicum]|uniref:Uncharacterized protein n=1 Tax=Candidatus Thiodictyon syntrophicum TaxID=1166950 RepID=A0A2K8UAH0_9GAMM|nr:hypothetical protein THSYN_17560 [Candidatus Thiodictyon syntrophicum]
MMALRAEILSAELSQKQFAADLHDVMLGDNPGIYHDPQEFFALTYPTARLRDLVRDVLWRLAGKSEKAVRQLYLTFGGGKTHALVTLVQLVRAPESLPDIPSVQQFRSHCGLPEGLPRARVAAVVFDHLDAEQGMEVCAPDGSRRRLLMPWSVLAWQLAGDAGLKVLKADGSERVSPPATNVMTQLLELARTEIPAVLILFDEVLWFARTMVDKDAAWTGRLKDFLHSLTQAVAKVPQCALVVSLLASDTNKMDALGRQISKELFDEIKRVSDEGVRPVESHDVPEILRRRLFTLASYQDRSAWPSQVYAALNSLEAVDAQTKQHRSTEEQRYLATYPFHPDLLEALYGKWTQLEGFQQTRGILKTLASALRDAAAWDKQPLIGAQVFLGAVGAEGLSTAANELANIAQVEQYDGRKQNWPAILSAELAHAAKAQEGLLGVAGREIEQAVMATFLHSQPIGQQAKTREVKLLVGLAAPDPINLDQGLAAWADNSWYLDDLFTGEREGGLPKVWRLGSKPNLKQMHAAARAGVSDSLVDVVLEKTIQDAAKLTDGARAAGAKVHKLPAKPADIDDDGLFHYAVLGPAAASDAGKPSAYARRFLDETTGPDKPRAQNRNAVVLAVPARDALAAARDKVRDLFGWEEVQRLLKERDDLDTVTTTRLGANLKSARAEVVSAVVLAYCIAVTVTDTNTVAAYRINVDNEPLFIKLLADRRLRIETSAVNAEALLPGGPYDLWAAGDTARFVKDLVGAFAATASLPKMLNREAILETLLAGCAAGQFVLRITRADHSQRTFWRARPDATATAEPTLEVVLPEAALLTDIDPATLAPKVLPGLWDSNEVPWQALTDYFSATHLVREDKGGWTESLLVPAAAPDALKAAVAAAVKKGTVWLINGTASLLEEEVPAGFVNEHALLLPPPAPLAATDLLPEQLPAAWNGDIATAEHMRAVLSAGLGRPLPWATLRKALELGFRLGLFERTLDCGPWPCDLGGAAAVKVSTVKDVVLPPPPPPADGSKVATAVLETHQIVDLADAIDELIAATAGHELSLTLTVTLHRATGPAIQAINGVNAVLEKVKPGWELH